MTFGFVDLFAGIGGFHAALSQLGGHCELACEIDPAARKIYENNWLRGSNTPFAHDVEDLARRAAEIEPYDVLAAGFPCQPFSKSGRQLGMEEARGTLFWSILEILRQTRPAVIMLENVRNLAGPRHRHEWNIIIRSLRDLGYKVPGQPTIFSPHLLPPWLGGTPQHRERVFITGVHVGKERAWAESTDQPPVENRPVEDWDPARWRIRRYLAEARQGTEIDRWAYRLSAEDSRAVDIWNDLVETFADKGVSLPGFPLWADAFQRHPRTDDSMPPWKVDFLKKNSAFYSLHEADLRGWLRTSGIRDLPAARRKLEWQARGAQSLWRTVFHFRPSGIRARPLTYVPALVAITQTSILGPERRRISPQEGAILQGFPRHFNFGDQPASKSYRQLGNAVAVGAVEYVLKEFLRQNASDLPPRLMSVLGPVESIDLSEA